MIVDLFQAYGFRCPVCDTLNYGEAIPAEMLPEECREAKQRLGYQPWEQGVFLHLPDEVTCNGCGSKFETND